jgi:ABC-type enterobactin transport system permease subunit
MSGIGFEFGPGLLDLIAWPKDHRRFPDAVALVQKFGSSKSKANPVCAKNLVKLARLTMIAWVLWIGAFLPLCVAITTFIWGAVLHSPGPLGLDYEQWRAIVWTLVVMGVMAYQAILSSCRQVAEVLTEEINA